MRVWLKIVIVAALCAAANAATGADEEHPRILATQPLLEKLRAEVRKPRTHHQQVYEAIKARVELSYQNMQKAYARGGEDAAEPLAPAHYAWGYRARETAFLALLAMTPQEQKKYAELSYKAAMETALRRADDLAGRMGAMSIALAYDWGCPAWTPQQRDDVRKRALAHLRGMPARDRVAEEYGFNKGGVHGGSEILLMLALCEEKNLKERYNHVKNHLIKHIETCYDAWGVSQEGPGYSEYPGSFLVPATLATRQLGDEDLAKALATRSFWKMLMYAWTFMDFERQSVMWGVASGGGPGEGWASALIGSVPTDQLPYYLWFYDRAEGIRSFKSPEYRFDPHRGNSPLAMLCYPIGVEPKDPTGVYPPSYYDQARGFAFLRNRWQDANDIQVTLSADAVKNAMGWDQPDALAMNLLAYNTRFFGGHCKRGTINDYTTLLVDGRYGSGDSLGKADTFEPAADGGYTIVDGGATYEKLKCDAVKRHLLAKFAAGKSQAVLSTLDRIKSSATHTYAWQGNLGNERGDDGAKTSGGQEAGRPMFLLRGRNEGFVKGWVVHPADAEVEAKGDPLRINVKGGDADIWVVILVGQGEPPAAAVAGSGLDSVLTVAGSKVRFDGQANRIRAE